MSRGAVDAARRQEYSPVKNRPSPAGLGTSWGPMKATRHGDCYRSWDVVVNADLTGLLKKPSPGGEDGYSTFYQAGAVAPFAHRGRGSSGTRGHTLIRKRNLLLGATCGSKPWGLSRCVERRWENSTASARPGPSPRGRLSGGSLPPTSSRRPPCSFPLPRCPRARPPARTSWPRTWGRR